MVREAQRLRFVLSSLISECCCCFTRATDQQIRGMTSDSLTRSESASVRHCTNRGIPSFVNRRFRRYSSRYIDLKTRHRCPKAGMQQLHLPPFVTLISLQPYLTVQNIMPPHNNVSELRHPSVCRQALPPGAAQTLETDRSRWQVGSRHPRMG